jgi:hypothetical protein
MNETDIELYLNRILCGYLIFTFNNEKYELRYPSNSLKYESNILYNNILNDEKYNEWIREEFTEKIMISLGLWQNNTGKILEKLEKNQETLKVDLFKNLLNKDMQNKIRPQIRTIEDHINRIFKTKQDFLYNTLEGYASSIKNEFIICNTLYKNNRLVFKNNEKQDQASYQFFNSLVNTINEHTIGMTIFKTIARSGLWRSYWNASKENIFGKPTIEWTDEQKSLVNITKMYDNVYEHPECPDDKVINDDDMLDGWIIVQKRKIKKQKSEQSMDSANPRLKNAQEVFILADNSEEAEEVFGLNSQEGIHRMKEKFGAIKGKENVDDLELPDVKRDALMELNNALKQRKS